MPGRTAPPDHLLAALRDKLRPSPPRRDVLAFGDTRVDMCFPLQKPQRGLSLGVLHEIGAAGLGAETGELSAAFAAALIARISSRLPVLWITPCVDLYPPATRTRSGAAGAGPLGR